MELVGETTFEISGTRVQVFADEGFEIAIFPHGHGTGRTRPVPENLVVGVYTSTKRTGFGKWQRWLLCWGAVVGENDVTVEVHRWQRHEFASVVRLGSVWCCQIDGRFRSAEVASGEESVLLPLQGGPRQMRRSLTRRHLRKLPPKGRLTE